MNLENEKGLPGISREVEEANLADTLSVIQHNIRTYGKDVSAMREEIDDMLEHFHDDNPELINTLENTMTMHENLKRALERNEKAQKKPYFGRIIFHDENLNKDESLYIGRGGISRDSTNLVVVDWRAPVSNAYYENGLGKCSYTAPNGDPIHIDLQLKRTYEIEDGKLLNYFDTEVISNDELLTKYLSKNKEAVLGEIVATIQQEQNNIIRKSPYHNVIVQGVAGSGKTTVAMHRISYILYNYAERFKPVDFYIVGSNRILLNYITGVLPDLDVYGVKQMTMEQLFVRLLYEDWDDQKYQIKSTDRTGKKGIIKGSLSWFKDLEAYCNDLEWNTILRDNIYLNPKQFVEGFQDGKGGVYDRTGGRPADPRKLILLVDGETVENYIRQNPTVSLQSKIDTLNERLKIKIKDEFLGRGVKYTEAEKKAILKAYHGKYGATSWKKSIFVMYEDFLTIQKLRGHDVDVPEDTFDVYDLAALAYLYKRIKETEVISEAHHVVIDEAQDFGMMAYSVLKFCIKDCTYTIMGDVSQNIHFGYGLNDWEELKKLFFTTDRASFDVLKKSYRNTVEISEFATKILHHGQFSVYPVEPIIRHGEQVQVVEVSEKDLVAHDVLKDMGNDATMQKNLETAAYRSNAMIQKAAEICREWQKKDLATIAVVCRNQETAAETATELGKYIEIMESNLEVAEFGNGIMVLPVEYTKGLEFDAVLILNPTREEYPVDDGHAKLLYVAATRALHELCVLHDGNLTGLIADPVPERSVKDIDSESECGAVPGQSQKLSAPVRDVNVVQKFDEQRSTPNAVHQPAKVNEKPTVAKTAKPTVVAKTKPAITAHTKPAGTVLPKTPYTMYSSPYGKPATVNSPAKPSLAGVTKPSMAGAPKSNISGQMTSGGYNGKPTVAAKPKVKAAKSTSGNSFGDIPATEILRPMGHAKIDMSVMWVNKQKDGLYIQCRYGVLRLCPISSDIIRITFAKGSQLSSGTHPRISVEKGFRAWMYKDSAKTVELWTDDLCLQVDKSTGAIRYMTGDKKMLLTERAAECRMIERAPMGNMCSWLYLEWPKGESIYAHRIADKFSTSLRGVTRYISHGDNTDDLPLLVSDKGYGILMATDAPTFCCDIATYGSYICAEKEEQLDYYFIVGSSNGDVLAAYEWLCGKENE